jgi:hypothetical protein
MRRVGNTAHMRAKMNAYRVLVGKPQEERPLARPRHTLENNIKMDLRDTK